MPPHSSPRYDLARTVAALFRGWAPVVEHPLADAWQQLVSLAGPYVDAIDRADQALQEGLNRARRTKEAIALGGSVAQRAEDAMQKAFTDAGPRFSTSHPSALKLALAHQAVGQAAQHEHAIMNEGLELERKHGSAQMAALIAKHYGTPAYQAGRLERWMDDRTAQKIGLSEFVQQQKQLMARLTHAKQVREAAQAQAASDQRAVEEAWEHAGMSYVDPKALDDAQQWKSLAMLDAEGRKALLQGVEQENSRARRALTQAICELHEAVGVQLRLLGGEESIQETLPEIDPTPFNITQPRSDEDHARVDALRKTHLAFLGQGHWPNHDLPAWVLLAYGNTEGLPGAAMAQATMGASALLAPHSPD